MRILVAGATGCIGRPLVRALVEAGHDVVGGSRKASSASTVEADGGRAVVLDILDADATARVVAEVQPDVVVHQATSLGELSDPRAFEKAFRATNRLRTEGTDNLLAASRAAGVTQVVAQSYTSWPYARTGGPIKTEDDALDPDPPAQMAPALAAIRHTEQAVHGVEGVVGTVLRYGTFYGPGTPYASDGAVVREVRRRRFPMVGDGGGIWSFVHVDDAARATVLAIEAGRGGLFNIVDDDPAPVRDWLPALVEILDAPRPMKLPAWLARVVAGPQVVALMTEIRGASNAKARAGLGWVPRWPSWRTGFAESLASGTSG